ncbi:MAG TPA: class I SAM-dependent methyltransferase [Polyangiaceae bacterium]|nr:class I SAM-dependent methyltransferase [Polyangiaceae bacterium]
MVSLGTPTDYDFSLPRIRRELFLQHALPLAHRRGSLLDYGCGNGANTTLFHADFDDVYGIDVEPDRVQEARARNIQPNVRYELYDGARIPGERMYDAVVSFEVLEHTASDAGSLAEIFGRMKAGGVFMCTVPNKFYLMETHGFRFPYDDVVPYNRIPFLNLLPQAVYDRFGNARIYTRRQIERLVAEAGFTIASSGYLRAPLDKLRNPRLQKLARRVIDRLPEAMGVSVWVVATKS